MADATKAEGDDDEWSWGIDEVPLFGSGADDDGAKVWTYL